MESPFTPHHHTSSYRHRCRLYDFCAPARGAHCPSALVVEADLQYRLNPLRPPDPPVDVASYRRPADVALNGFAGEHCSERWGTTVADLATSGVNSGMPGHSHHRHGQDVDSSHRFSPSYEQTHSAAKQSASGFIGPVEHPLDGQGNGATRTMRQNAGWCRGKVEATALPRMRQARGLKRSYAQQQVQQWSIQHTLTGHDGCINSISIDAAGEYLVTGSDDTCLCLYDTSFWERKTKFQTEHTANIFSAVFMDASQGGTGRVMSCGADGVVLLNDLETGNSVVKLSSFSHASSIAVSSHWPSVAYVALDSGQLARVDCRVEPHDLRPRNSLPFTPHPISDEDFLQATRPAALTSVSLTALAVHERYPYLLAVGSNSPYVLLHDVRMGLMRPFAALCDGSGGSSTRKDGVGGLCFSQRGDYLAVNYREADLAIFPWEEAVRGALESYNRFGYEAPSVQAGFDTWAMERVGFVASRLPVDDCHSIPVIPCTNTRHFTGRHNETTMFKEVAFLEDDTVVCTGGDDGDVYFWRTEDQRLIHQTRGDDDVVNGVLYHPKVKQLVVCGIDSTAKVMGPDVTEQMAAPPLPQRVREGPQGRGDGTASLPAQWRRVEGGGGAAVWQRQRGSDGDREETSLGSDVFVERTLDGALVFREEDQEEEEGVNVGAPIEEHHGVRTAPATPVHEEGGSENNFSHYVRNALHFMNVAGGSTEDDSTGTSDHSSAITSAWENEETFDLARPPDSYNDAESTDTTDSDEDEEEWESVTDDSDDPQARELSPESFSSETLVSLTSESERGGKQLSEWYPSAWAITPGDAHDKRRRVSKQERRAPLQRKVAPLKSLPANCYSTQTSLRNRVLALCVRVVLMPKMLRRRVLDHVLQDVRRGDAAVWMYNRTIQSVNPSFDVDGLGEGYGGDSSLDSNPFDEDTDAESSTQLFSGAAGEWEEPDPVEGLIGLLLPGLSAAEHASSGSQTSSESTGQSADNDERARVPVNRLESRDDVTAGSRQGPGDEESAAQSNMASSSAWTTNASRELSAGGEGSRSSGEDGGTDPTEAYERGDADALRGFARMRALARSFQNTLNRVRNQPPIGVYERLHDAEEERTEVDDFDSPVGRHSMVYDTWSEESPSVSSDPEDEEEEGDDDRPRRRLSVPSAERGEERRPKKPLGTATVLDAVHRLDRLVEVFAKRWYTWDCATDTLRPAMGSADGRHPRYTPVWARHLVTLACRGQRMSRGLGNGGCPVDVGARNAIVPRDSEVREGGTTGESSTEEQSDFANRLLRLVEERDRRETFTDDEPLTRRQQTNDPGDPCRLQNWSYIVVFRAHWLWMKSTLALLFNILWQSENLYAVKGLLRVYYGQLSTAMRRIAAFYAASGMLGRAMLWYDHIDTFSEFAHLSCDAGQPDVPGVHPSTLSSTDASGSCARTWPTAVMRAVPDVLGFSAFPDTMYYPDLRITVDERLELILSYLHVTRPLDEERASLESVLADCSTLAFSGLQEKVWVAAWEVLHLGGSEEEATAVCRAGLPEAVVGALVRLHTVRGDYERGVVEQERLDPFLFRNLIVNKVRSLMWGSS